MHPTANAVPSEIDMVLVIICSGGNDVGGASPPCWLVVGKTRMRGESQRRTFSEKSFRRFGFLHHLPRLSREGIFLPPPHRPPRRSADFLVQAAPLALHLPTQSDQRHSKTAVLSFITRGMLLQLGARLVDFCYWIAALACPHTNTKKNSILL